MPLYNKFISSHNFVNALSPKDITGAAQTTGWIYVAPGNKIIFVIIQGAWAGGTPALTFEQALDSAGASPKALPYEEKYTLASTVGAKAVQVPVAANTSNLLAVAGGITLVEIDSVALDQNNGYKTVRALVASPLANADLLAILAITDGLRYQGDPTRLAVARAS